MKITKKSILCVVLGSSLMCSSCIGSFGLWNNLKEWNEGLGQKFVNEIVFMALHLIPVYEVAYIADVLVLNSIEFWTGTNPLADVGRVKTVKGEDGEYLVKTNIDGYTIIKIGEEDTPLNLVYNRDNRTWNAVTNGGNVFELITMNEDGTVTFKQADGTPMTISPDLVGLAAAQAANGQSFMAVK